MRFCGDLWCQKTRDSGLLWYAVSMILHLAVLLEFRLVTHGWTDRWQTQGHSIYHASIASHGKIE